MHYNQNILPYVVSRPQTVNSGSATANVIDARGYNHVDVICVIGSSDVAFTALKLSGSDDYANDYTDVVTYSGGALPAATDDCQTFVLSTHRKYRYYKLTATAGAGASGAEFTAVAILGDPSVAPVAGGFSGFSGFSGYNQQIG